jgi:hypothetical protein
MPSLAALNAAARTSFKQYVHARQASGRYKAAYNGAGPAIVQVVENAAAYFEGRDNGESLASKKRCFERYQFNVDLLTEIFDGPVPDQVTSALSGYANCADSDRTRPQDGHSTASAGELAEAVATENGATTAQKPRAETSEVGAQLPATAAPKQDLNGGLTAEERKIALTDSVMDRLAQRMRSRSNPQRANELVEAERSFLDMEAADEMVERINVRAFEKLERAHTAEEVDKARQEYEVENEVRIKECPGRMIQRRVDKNEPLVMPPSSMRIIKFP